MKKTIFYTILMSLLLASCSGLSKMKSDSKKVRYQATPNPVETRDDKVVVKFVGSIPEKYFNKKAAVFVQPVFTWEGGAIPLNPITLKGENVNGEGITINYENGGRFTYTDELDFKPGMETGRVTLAPVAYTASTTDDEAKFPEEIQYKTVTFPTVLISDGVNTTSTWVNIRGNISISPINYNKTQGVVETADIYFPNGLSTLDWNFQMNRVFNSKSQLEELRRIMLENGLPKQITITGWASPEGEETNNVGVSKNRAEVATTQIKRVLDDVLNTMAKRKNVPAYEVDHYKYELMKQIVVSTRAAGEDWVHFIIMVEESDIQDKHAIVNIVETQQNLIKREQMIKNMAETYTQLNTEIFPNLRRAQIALYYSEARKTDPELAKQASLNPAKLTFDELMYAAYINYNYDTKLKYYKWATENYSSEWAGWNNAGAVSFYLGDYKEAVRENIRLGRPSASDAEVEEVARQSGCYEFIMSLENGFDTIVGGSGAHLSGGERQRIAIARAMMKNAPIVILDEATAYTDPENEAIIQKSVAKLVQGKTLIVIAHRLSTVKDADKLYVIKDGNIDSCGTHQELLEKGGLYKSMWQAHISAKDSEEDA